MPLKKSIQTIAQRRGYKLRLCRKLAGFARKRLADAANCDASFISLLENGGRDLGHTGSETVTRIANAFGLTHQEFFDLVIDQWDPEVDSTASAPDEVEPETVGGQP